MLAANAIGTPVINALAPAEWLSLSGTFRRILGFAVTIGVVEEILKYLVIRYTIWPDRLRIRLDAVAYTNAAAIGYVMALNLHLALSTSLSTDDMAGRIFANMAIHLAAGMVVAYGMADLRFNPRSLLLMPVTLILASLIHGLGITARSGLMNAGFALGVASSRPLFGLALSAVIIGMVVVITAFLFTNVEREEREVVASRER
jgi:RsiW-degrading membrane proteinase PrsW (M82 family)